MSTPTTRAALAVAVPLTIAALLAAAGCGGGSAPEPAEPPIGAVPTVLSDADIVLPLDAYLPTDEQVRTVSRAIEVLGRQCMAQFGLDWPDSPPETGPADQPGGRHARRYFILDPVSAGQTGYHPTREIQEQQRRLTGDRPDAAPPPSADAMNVWAGQGERSYHGVPVPEGGCAGQASRALAGGRWLAEGPDVQRMQLDSWNRMEQDSRVRAAFRRWRACMKADGFDYPDPRAANNDRRWQTGAPSGAETATAVADVACKHETNLAGTMLAVETAYQLRAIEADAEALADVKAATERQITTAAELIGTGTR